MSMKSMLAASALAVGCGALWAGPGLTADGTPGASAQSQPKASQGDDSRRICRNLVLSGTRLSRRSCRTQDSWDHDAEAARRMHEDGQRNGGSQDAQNTGARPMGSF